MRKYLAFIAAGLLCLCAWAQQAQQPDRPEAKPSPELARQMELKRMIQAEVRDQLTLLRASGSATGGAGDMADTRVRQLETEVASLRREVQSLQQAIWNIQSRTR
ncbi:MAG: hypothetical protein R2729_27585 [Bryobacteraceae bacterium]